MVRECVICGRELRTGRKYCYEHRNSANAEDMRTERKLYGISRGYKRYRLKGFWLSIHRYWGILSFCSILFGGLIVSIFIDSINKGETLFIILSPFLFIALVFFILKIIVEIKIFFLDEEIENRNPQYINFVKSWVESDKEEKNFKRDLLE